MTSLLSAAMESSSASRGALVTPLQSAAEVLIFLSAFATGAMLFALALRRRSRVGLIACLATFLVGVALSALMPLVGAPGLVSVWLEAATAMAGLATTAMAFPLVVRPDLAATAESLPDSAMLGRLAEERDAALDELRTQTARREQAEARLAQAQKLEAVGQLTSGIAHDFNNLLQAVCGNLELIARRPDDPDKVVRWSASALDAAERGRSLTGQLLAFSRRQRFQARSVRLADLVAGMRDLMERAVAPLSRLRIEPIDPTLNVEVDALQLELALLNVAFNARDAMPGGGTLTVRALARSGAIGGHLPAGDYVALTLEDSGEGMAPDVLARALDPAFSTKPVDEATGMGLSMALGVAREAGGTLVIDSQPGRGTQVTFFLRVAAVEPSRALEADPTEVAVDLAGSTILLVDDDAHVRASLSETLAAAGAQVREAASGVDALAQLAGSPPDLLIVDFAMPGMTGAELVRRARAEIPGLPVLIVTGVAGPQVPAVGDGDAVLRKPFEAQELLQRVGELLVS